MCLVLENFMNSFGKFKFGEHFTKITSTSHKELLAFTTTLGTNVTLLSSIVIDKD